jgi:hypothetical protein
MEEGKSALKMLVGKRTEKAFRKAKMLEEFLI